MVWEKLAADNVTTQKTTIERNITLPKYGYLEKGCAEKVAFTPEYLLVSQ
jgi:hypothetical protein